MIHRYICSRRYANEDLTVQGHALKRGDQIALMLGAAGRDPTNWRDPDVFDPSRDLKQTLPLGQASILLGRRAGAFGIADCFADCF